MSRLDTLTIRNLVLEALAQDNCTMQDEQGRITTGVSTGPLEILKRAKIYHLGEGPLREALDRAKEWSNANFSSAALPDILDIAPKVTDLELTLPWPELPFDDVYLGYGGGVYLDDDLTQGIKENILKLNYKFDYSAKIKLMGHILSNTADKGQCWSIMATILHGAEGPSIIFPASRSSLGFWQLYGPCPIVAPLILDFIKNHRQFVTQDRLTKSQRKQWGKKDDMGGAPPPFYSINLKQRVTLPSFAPKLNSMPMLYRHDRTSHERCHIFRGSMPLPSDEREQLESRKFKVYEHLRMSPEDAQRLAERGKPPKKVGEWVAIRSMLVKSCVVGDEALPYRPAIRTV